MKVTCKLYSDRRWITIAYRGLRRSDKRERRSVKQEQDVPFKWNTSVSYFISARVHETGIWIRGSEDTNGGKRRRRQPSGPARGWQHRYSRPSRVFILPRISTGGRSRGRAPPGSVASAARSDPLVFYTTWQLPTTTRWVTNTNKLSQLIPLVGDPIPPRTFNVIEHTNTLCHVRVLQSLQIFRRLSKR